MIVTRFAPSPNGPLHLGHAYAALRAHDLAHERNGQFLLRIEDIDGERSRPAFVEEILADLQWLGLAWDGPVLVQSQRLASYAEAGERLKAMGLLYTCRTRDVDPHGAAWRLDVGKAMALTGPLEWRDENAGLQIATPRIFGDVVLLRKDLPASYHLAATLDDSTDGITLVTRGMDLFPASHVHRLLQALLGLPAPIYRHHGLVRDAAGRKLSKSEGARGLAALRAAGATAEDVRRLVGLAPAQPTPST